MRFSSRALAIGLCLVAGASASGVEMDWTFVGDPDNACDPQGTDCFGSVAYSYFIGTYEVTNAQYAEFLNAKAASDPLGLYDPWMAFDYDAVNGESIAGILQNGSDGAFSYSVTPGYENMPVRFVTYYDILRFANWMNNGQGSGDTETGAYTLLGGTHTPSNYAALTRNAGATIFVPSEDEWFKAAYYDPVSATYFDFPMGSDTVPICGPPSAAANTANCGGALGVTEWGVPIEHWTPVGSYPGSPSPYGTFDQGGNVREYTEGFDDPSSLARATRGGSYSVLDPAEHSGAAFRYPADGLPSTYLGFRLVMLPEPDAHLLLLAGVLGVACCRRGRA